LLAARLEGVRVEVVGLYGVRDDVVTWSDAERERARQDALEKYARVFASEDRLSDRSRLDANRSLTGAWSDHWERRSTTPAIYRGDLRARFAADLDGLDVPDEVRDALLA